MRREAEIDRPLDGTKRIGAIAFLHHGTSSRLVETILANGLRAGSHWTPTEDVARLFARGACCEAPGEPVVITLPWRRFDPGLFAIDEAMIDFPVFSDVQERWRAWSLLERPPWRHGLLVYESVVYGHALDVGASDIGQRTR